MKVSVVIPTYNSSAVIQATLETVLRQTSQPEEILVLDDGSSDNTVSIVKACSPRITVLQQKNRGVAHARNVLSERAQGEILAFLDHDDLWHPGYLETQKSLLEKHPRAIASFTGHINFKGTGGYEWPTTDFTAPESELIPPTEFLSRYNKCPGPFASMSFCCIRKQVLGAIGAEPFTTSASGADDFYLFNILPSFGSIVYFETPLVAYRMISTAQSEDRLKGVGLAVKCFELLEVHHQSMQNPQLSAIFREAFSSKRRQYAKFLMGAGDVAAAQIQLKHSFRNNLRPISLSKSLVLLFLTNLPATLQPRWPSRYRTPDSNADPV